MFKDSTFLEKYIPESDMVRITFEELKGEKIINWNSEIENLARKTLEGDVESLKQLLELVYLNAFNEGELQASADYKGG